MPRMRARTRGWLPPELYRAQPPQYDRGDGKYFRPRGHTCGECFGPRSAYGESLFCNVCETKLFGCRGYKNFLRSMRVRNSRRRKVD